MLDRLAFGLWTYFIALIVGGVLVCGLAEVGLLPSLAGWEIEPPHFLVVGAIAIGCGVTAAISTRTR